MKKIEIGLRDEHFGSILCANNIRATKIIKFKFVNYDRTIDEILRMFYKFKSLEIITVYEIYYVCQTLGYLLEEINGLKLDPDCKLKVNAVKQFITTNNGFGILLYVDLLPKDINDSMKRYLENDMQATYDLCYFAQRGGGKSQMTKFMHNMMYDYKVYEDFVNKLKGGENKMIDILPTPKRVICSGPVTTVIYEDRSKTHVRKMEEDANDYEKAFLLSWLYKTYGKKVVNKKLEEFQEEFNVEESTKDDDIVVSAKAIAKRMNDFLKVSSKKYLG